MCHNVIAAADPNNTLDELTRKRYKQFTDDLDHYWTYFDEQCSPKNKAYNYYTPERKREIKKCVTEANELFLDLRLKIQDMIYAKYGNHPATRDDFEEIDHEMMNWYADLVSDFLFPQGWEVEKEKSQ